MTEFVNHTNLDAYEAFVQSHPKGHFSQSSLWAKQKPAWRWKAVICRDGQGAICGSIAFLIRRMPIVRRNMLYACRGPVCDLDDRKTFHELMEAAKRIAQAERAYVIKIDPDVPSSNTEFVSMLEQLCLPQHRQEFRGHPAALRLPALSERPRRGGHAGILPSEMAL